MAAKNEQTTVLKDFGRSLRNEKWFLAYNERFYFKENKIPPQEMITWLRMRYAESRRGHLYRVVTYKNIDGNRYVDFIYLEKISDTDQVYMQMRWGIYGRDKEPRTGERTPRRKLTKDQRIMRDALMERVLEDFYNNL